MKSKQFDDYSNNNRIKSNDLTQEWIRIVKYLPENRLVCVDNALWGDIWDHPEDVLQDKPKKKVFERNLEKAKEYLEEVTFDEIVAVGWDKYLLDK